MNQSLTSNAQAILLLTAPLIVGRGGESLPLLSLGEYNRLARTLREERKQPGDLIGPEASAVLGLCDRTFDRSRLVRLLARGFLLAQAVERWHTRAIWVVSRADHTYPQHLKRCLKEDAPPILYGCGDASLLETGGLAVVGSRQVDAHLLNYTTNVGRLAAEAGLTLISGGARGIDRAAMDGALQSGGSVAGVLAERLEQAAIAGDNREALLEGKLVLVSAYDPCAGFQVGHAMQRNKLIYALSDAAFVVNAEFEKGGTWAGAVEQLERLHLVPLFVRNGANSGSGNLALLRRGGVPWPEPQSVDALKETISSASRKAVGAATQELFPFSSRSGAVEIPNTKSSRREETSSTSDLKELAAGRRSAERIFAVVQEVLQKELMNPRTESDIAETLDVSKNQAKSWLKKLVELGVAERITKPIRYRIVSS
jgi:DNA processing protein